MKFNEIISISGKSGLYRLLNTRADGIIVQNLEDDKSTFVSTRINSVITLDNIAIYRDNEETTPLRDVLIAMKENESKHEIPAAGSDEISLRSYIEQILPDYDKQRVHLSDLKKLVKWYHIMKQKNILPEPEVATKDAVETDESTTSNDSKPEKTTRSKSNAKKSEE